MQWATVDRAKRKIFDRIAPACPPVVVEDDEDEVEISSSVLMRSKQHLGSNSDRPRMEPEAYRSEVTEEDDKTEFETKSLWESRELTVDPGGKIAYYWMGIVTAAVVYNCAVVVLRVAFADLRESPLYQGLFSSMDTISDLIYLLDIVVQSRTGFLEDGCLVYDVPRLAQHYKEQTHFVIDIVAILPFHTAYTIFGELHQLCPCLDFITDPTKLVVPILRLARLLKSHTVTHFFEVTDSRTSNPNLLRAFKLSLYLWMVIHWIGCIYYMISEYEGLGSNEWVYAAGKQHQSLKRKYIRCTFWSMMTLTTIGERPTPVTDLEYVFTGMIFLIGVFVFAAVVGNVGDVISNMHAARQDFQARMDHIKFYMQHRHVPEELQERVKRWAEYSWTRTQAIDEPGLLQFLPDRLRAEVAIHVHLDTLKKVKIFEECEEGLLRELVLKLRSQIYSPGDYICRTGEIGREMYILNHGKVEILVPNLSEDTKTRVAVLSPGNYFGEISLLKLDQGQNRRTADVRAIGYSELLCLSRKDLLSALVEYPEAKAILEAQAKERMQQTQGMGKRGSRWPSVGSSSSKKKVHDVFAEVMRQEGYQTLLSTKGQEMSELRQIINDLKALNAQTSSHQVEMLNRKCQLLESECKKKDEELLKRNNRILQLETMMQMTCNFPSHFDHQLPDIQSDTVNGVSTVNKLSDVESDTVNGVSTVNTLSDVESDTVHGVSTVNTLSNVKSDTVNGVSTMNTLSNVKSDTVNGVSTMNTLSNVKSDTVNGVSTMNTLSDIQGDTVNGVSVLNTLSDIQRSTVNDISAMNTLSDVQSDNVNGVVVLNALTDNRVGNIITDCIGCVESENNVFKSNESFNTQWHEPVSPVDNRQHNTDMLVRNSARTNSCPTINSEITHLLDEVIHPTINITDNVTGVCDCDSKAVPESVQNGQTSVSEVEVEVDESIPYLSDTYSMSSDQSSNSDSSSDDDLYDYVSTNQGSS